MTPLELTLPLLERGDTVAVVSPSGPVLPENIEVGLATIESWGLKAELIGPFERHAGYLAGTDEHRAGALQEALDGDFKCIMATRGGYGAMRILSRLDFTRFSEAPSLLCGFSDITALHLHIAGKLGIPTLHSPVLKSFGTQEHDIPLLRRFLFGELRPDDLSWALRPLNTIEGSIEGPLIGGNLTLLTLMLDSDFCPDLRGAILFIEDVGEADYRVDRLLTSLRLSKKAKGLAALVLGEFTECQGVYAGPDTIQTLIEDTAAEFPCPVFTGLPVGHGRRNVPLPLGLQARIEPRGAQASFSFADSIFARISA